MIQIDIETDANLKTIEDIFTRLGKLSTSHEITVRLSRNLRWDFILESRLATLLATTARHHRLTVCDWYDRWEDNDIEEQFRTSLVGMAAVFHARRISNIAGQDLPDDRGVLLERVGINGGILEPRLTGSRGKSVTFCAFDPDWGEPAALAGTLNRKDLFRRTFEKYRRVYLEVGQAMSHTRDTRQADQRLARFIFELYQNTYEHGRPSAADGFPAKGMRYVRLRKYIGRKSAFLSRAGHFEEMTDYLSSVIQGDDFKFYEISVSDDGLGMLNHFLQKSPDYSHPASFDDRVRLLNKLLTTSLTSKVNYPGAGEGLPNVLKAITQLRGFMSLRTDRVWLYGHSEGTEQPLEEKGLLPVTGAEDLSSIVGTQFNIVLPLRRE